MIVQQQEMKQLIQTGEKKFLSWVQGHWLWDQMQDVYKRQIYTKLHSFTLINMQILFKL